MKRGGPLKRYTPLRVISRRRRRAEAALANVRLDLLERSHGHCEARFTMSCTGIGEHAHHILPRSAGGTHDAANLLWVCHACHSAIHNYPIQAQWDGFLRSRYEDRTA